jgi:hypothetical protein
MSDYDFYGEINMLVAGAQARLNDQSFLQQLKELLDVNPSLIPKTRSKYH